ncbi:dihydrofolate synthase / folylpolyglutamate synthase [Methylophilaceae bacterium]|nr:dihydrofolate synthase / folylpolyglutamate synthase [Methylophilaceae bacterium]
MGLDRVAAVKQRLRLAPDFPLITVAGTNGKGSACAMLERIYLEAGYRVACYSSPHLLRYNERVRIDGLEVSDQALVKAFIAVERARQDIPLTYFEFGTLAAIWHFQQVPVEVAILEVGLGGRLDAVNAFDARCAIVTGIDLDHMDYLGDSRESIAFEKAGIFRPGMPAICGDADPPHTLTASAEKIGADIKLSGRDFQFRQGEDCWDYLGAEVIADLPLPALTGDFQLNNAACVLAALESMMPLLPVSKASIMAGLASVKLAGRFQKVSRQPLVILDVAHNPQAARVLAENLRRLGQSGRTMAVFGMLADKDIAGVIAPLYGEVDAWYVAGVENARGASAAQLHALLLAHDVNANVRSCSSLVAAYHQACRDAGKNDKIIIFGSFFTVSEVMQALPEYSVSKA